MINNSKNFKQLMKIQKKLKLYLKKVGKNYYFKKFFTEK